MIFEYVIISTVYYWSRVYYLLFTVYYLEGCTPKTKTNKSMYKKAH